MFDVSLMRTTLNLDEDILLAAKDLAAHRGETTGKVLSDLARQALKPKNFSRMRNGVPLFKSSSGGGVVTMELVNRLRDEAP